MVNKIFKEIIELEGIHITSEIKFKKFLKGLFEEFNKKYEVKKINVINKKKVEVFLIKNVRK